MITEVPGEPVERHDLAGQRITKLVLHFDLTSTVAAPDDRRRARGGGHLEVLADAAGTANRTWRGCAMVQSSVGGVNRGERQGPRVGSVKVKVALAIGAGHERSKAIAAALSKAERVTVLPATGLTPSEAKRVTVTSNGCTDLGTERSTFHTRPMFLQADRGVSPPRRSRCRMSRWPCRS